MVGNLYQTVLSHTVSSRHYFIVHLVHKLKDILVKQSNIRKYVQYSFTSWLKCWISIYLCRVFHIERKCSKMTWQNLILDKLHSVHTAQQSYLLPYWPITYNPSFPIGPLHNPLLSIGPAGAARPFPIVWDNLKWQISSILLVYVIIPSSLLVHVTMHVFFFSFDACIV